MIIICIIKIHVQRVIKLLGKNKLFLFIFKIFIYYLSIHVCVCGCILCVCIHVCPYIHAEGSEEDVKCPMLSLSTLFPWDGGHSLNLELGLAASKHPILSVVPLPQHIHKSLTVGSGGFNSDPDARASALIYWAISSASLKRTCWSWLGEYLGRCSKWIF